MSGYEEEDYLQLSGIQHFSFCRRQWALIHVEHLWEENVRTVEGALMHERVHEAKSDRRGDLLNIRGMRVSSRTLGVSGICDLVEFHLSPDGVPLIGHEGYWLPYPVEYKRGKAKVVDADRLQLCCQAMCLEEMLAVDIREAALFYGEPRRREIVNLSPTLRSSVVTNLKEMHELYRRGYTPKVKTGSFCRSCSLQDLCVPKLCKNRSVSSYIAQRLKEVVDETFT